MENNYIDEYDNNYDSDNVYIGSDYKESEDIDYDSGNDSDPENYNLYESDDLDLVLDDLDLVTDSEEEPDEGIQEDLNDNE